MQPSKDGRKASRDVVKELTLTGNGQNRRGTRDGSLFSLKKTGMERVYFTVFGEEKTELLCVCEDRDVLPRVLVEGTWKTVSRGMAEYMIDKGDFLPLWLQPGDRVKLFGDDLVVRIIGDNKCVYMMDIRSGREMRYAYSALLLNAVFYE